MFFRIQRQHESGFHECWSDAIKIDADPSVLPVPKTLLLNYTLQNTPFQTTGSSSPTMDRKQFLSQLSRKENNVPVEEGQECLICKEEYGARASKTEKPERQIRLPCNGKHTVGSKCIVAWLQAHNTCPVCRYEFFPAEKTMSERFHELYVLSGAVDDSSDDDEEEDDTEDGEFVDEGGETNDEDENMSDDDSEEDDDDEMDDDDE